MIYSVWQPDTGTYEYWSAPNRVGLGDDLPTPVLPTINGIAASSTLAGRPIPAGAVRVGSGQVPIGAIAPMNRSGLSGTVGEVDPLVQWGLVAVAACLGFVIGKRFN